MEDDIDTSHQELINKTVEEIEGLDESKEEKNKGFKLLLKKYQGLVVDYYKQDLETKKSVAVVIQRNELLTQENKRLHEEINVLKNTLERLINRMDSIDYGNGESCMTKCCRRYYNYDPRYDKSLRQRDSY